MTKVDASKERVKGGIFGIWDKYQNLMSWPSGSLSQYKKKLTLCLLGNFSCFFLSSANSFQNELFRKIHSGIPSECQTVWIQIRPDVLSGLIWFQTVCKKLSADDTRRQRDTNRITYTTEHQI